MTGKCECLTIIINRRNFLLLPRSPGPEAHGLTLAWSVAITFYQSPAQRSLRLRRWLQHSNVSLRTVSILWLTGEEIFILTHSFREQEFQKAWWDITAYNRTVRKKTCTDGVLPSSSFTLYSRLVLPIISSPSNSNEFFWKQPYRYTQKCPLIISQSLLNPAQLSTKTSHSIWPLYIATLFRNRCFAQRMI